jgi:hypothetical protein
MTPEPTVEQKAEELARLASARAAELALHGAERAQKIAVDRAVKDANIDRDLRDHERHLAEINGSQRDMAKSLSALQTSFEEMTIANKAVAAYVVKRSGSQFSRLTLWIMALGVIASYAALLGLLIANGH